MLHILPKMRAHITNGKGGGGEAFSSFMKRTGLQTEWVGVWFFLGLYLHGEREDTILCVSEVSKNIHQSFISFELLANFSQLSIVSSFAKVRITFSFCCMMLVGGYQYFLSIVDSEGELDWKGHI
jgi:hypothetical protein